MVCKCINGEYLFHQPCGLWNEPCVHGCGYIHLLNLTPGNRKKCCVNGRLSSASDNFDEELMMGYVLDELPSFVRKVISSGNKFSQKSSLYNNLVAMAATVVCNYNETAGFSRRGPVPQSGTSSPKSSSLLSVGRKSLSASSSGTSSQKSSSG
jgi:hypothetical protein